MLGRSEGGPLSERRPTASETGSLAAGVEDYESWYGAGLFGRRPASSRLDFGLWVACP